MSKISKINLQKEQDLRRAITSYIANLFEWASRKMEIKYQVELY